MNKMAYWSAQLLSGQIFICYDKLLLLFFFTSFLWFSSSLFDGELGVYESDKRQILSKKALRACFLISLSTDEFEPL